MAPRLFHHVSLSVSSLWQGRSKRTERVPAELATRLRRRMRKGMRCGPCNSVSNQPVLWPLSERCEKWSHALRSLAEQWAMHEVLTDIVPHSLDESGERPASVSFFGECSSGRQFELLSLSLTWHGEGVRVETVLPFPHPGQTDFPGLAMRWLAQQLPKSIRWFEIYASASERYSFAPVAVELAARPLEDVERNRAIERYDSEVAFECAMLARLTTETTRVVPGMSARAFRDRLLPLASKWPLSAPMCTPDSPFPHVAAVELSYDPEEDWAAFSTLFFREPHAARTFLKHMPSEVRVEPEEFELTAEGDRIRTGVPLEDER